MSVSDNSTVAVMHEDDDVDGVTQGEMIIDHHVIEAQDLSCKSLV